MKRYRISPLSRPPSPASVQQTVTPPPHIFHVLTLFLLAKIILSKTNDLLVIRVFDIDNIIYSQFFPFAYCSQFCPFIHRAVEIEIICQLDLQLTMLFPQYIILFPQHIILFPQYIMLFPIQDGHQRGTQFNIEPYGKYIQRSPPQKLLGQLKPNLVTIVLRQSPFKIASVRSGFDPR